MFELEGQDSCTEAFKVKVDVEASTTRGVGMGGMDTDTALATGIESFTCPDSMAVADTVSIEPAKTDGTCDSGKELGGLWG